MGTNYHTAYSNTAPKTTFTVASLGSPLSDLDRAITYNRPVIIGSDGAISWSAGTLTWSGTLHFYFVSAAGLAIHNSVAAGSRALSDGQFAYVTLSETNNAVLTVGSATISTGAASNYKAYNLLVLGFRNIADDNFYPVGLAGCFKHAIVSGDLAAALASPPAIGETTPNTVRSLMKEVIKTATGSLSALDVSGTIINNYGQADDVTLTLPTAAAGLSFTVILGTSVGKYFRIDPQAADKIYLDGTGGDDGEYVGIANAVAGSAISFAAFQTGAGAFDWLATSISGPWAAE